LHECSASWHTSLACVSQLTEGRKIRKSADHRHTVRASELGYAYENCSLLYRAPEQMYNHKQIRLPSSPMSLLDYAVWNSFAFKNVPLKG